MLTDLEYLIEAYRTAVLYGTDLSTQNGAILVNPAREIIARAANRFPRGVVETTERWKRPTKYQYVEHAERNAIFTAAKLGRATNGATLYVPWFACSDCARAIIQAGIKEVIGHKKMCDKTPDRWKESVQIGWTMLNEAEVPYRFIEGDIGIEILFNGEKWTA